MRDVVDAGLQQPQHLGALEVELGDRLDVAGQLAARSRAELLAPERLFDLLVDVEEVPRADDVELLGIELGRCGCLRGGDASSDTRAADDQRRRHSEKCGEFHL
jgi:hypothetical protein